MCTHLGVHNSSIENLNDGGSQSGFIIYLVGEHVCSSLMLQSNKICRVVKSAMGTEILILVETAEEASFWLANLFHEIVWLKAANKKLKTLWPLFMDGVQLPKG